MYAAYMRSDERDGTVARPVRLYVDGRGMKLIIAEKPELGRDIARAVCGAADDVRLPYEGRGYRVVACRGHLLELMEPGEIREEWARRYDLSQLPILPRPWPKKPKEGCERALADIERGLRECSGAVNAGDPDDEGQMLVDEVLEWFHYKGPVERVYVNNNLPDEIRRAFARLSPNSEHVGDGLAAEARALADFCFGVNESRLISIKAGNGTHLTAGRVKSPTLGLVVRRDEEIMGHHAREYYIGRAHAHVGEADAVLTFSDGEATGKDGKCFERARVEQALADIEGASATLTVENGTESKAAPLPYNLTDLTADMSRRYKMSAKRVMDATQSLREKHKAITYNRSDCNYLPREAHAQAPAVLGCAMRNIGTEWKLDFSLCGRCFDDSAITAHTGIIPQDRAVSMSRLSEDERHVYVAIAERYAMQFLPPLRTDTARAVLRVPGGSMTYAARRVRDAGWKALQGVRDGDTDGTWLRAGTYPCTIAETSIEAKKTKPRPPYTSGTLVKDMSSIAKYVEDKELADVLMKKDEGKKGEHGGIGTTATRAAVIEELIRNGYIEEKGGKLFSTNLGREIYHAYPPEIRGADLTAKWYLMCEEVRAGHADVYSVAESVCEEFRRHKDSAYEGIRIARAGQKVGTCPVCGAAVVDYGPEKKSYTCSSNKFVREDDGFKLVQGCGFMLSKRVAGKKLTLKQVGDLLRNGRTDVIDGFSSKKGGRFSARLVLRDGRCEFEFNRADGRRRAHR